MNKKKAVVSLGHNALGYTTMEQWDAVKVTAKSLADLVEAGYQLTITHSNGPQVSMIHKAMTELRRVYIDYTPAPMCVCNAMSQGYVGYDIQNALKAELQSRGLSNTVCTILTQVTVDPYDEAFYAPTKVIGRFMSAEDADMEVKKGNHVKEEPGKGFRRVVAAPKPIEIVELDAIKLLSDADQVVIACGGGGIPVIDQGSTLRGASAVIEKDAIASKLADSLSADCMFILTGVPCVYENFGTDNQQPINELKIAKAKEMDLEQNVEQNAEIKSELLYESEANSFIVKNAIAYIKDNYKEKLRLIDVADQIYVSQWHLSKLLNKHTGQNFSEILNGIRMEKAKELLKDPSLRIGDIAEEVGFLDMAHFSRVFKKQEGMSANEYRNKIK